MAGISGQIIGELGELGKQVGGEVVKAPKEIAGKALESLGSKSGKKQQNQTISGKPSEAGDKPSPLRELDQKKARAALEYLAGKPKPKEPSVWEKIQKEEEQKKEQAAKQAAQAAASALPVTPSKPKRGNLYGIAQKASAEKSRNVRQD